MKDQIRSITRSLSYSAIWQKFKIKWSAMYIFNIVLHTLRDPQGVLFQ